MPAEPLLNERHVLDAETFVEIVIWRVPTPVNRSRHGFKYRMALAHRGDCVLRYDNEAGKGDHRHAGTMEEPYPFTDPDTLLTDFWSDVQSWRQRWPR